MATEKLKFKIELFSTMWDLPPQVEILINDKSFYKNSISATEEAPEVIEFEHETKEGNEYNLQIKLFGKQTNQTVVNEKGDILNDQLLNIKNIEIDEIDIGSLVYKGEYTPEYPQPWAAQQAESGNTLPKSLQNVTQMGHNGTWQLKFTAPFYMWLLENLY